MYMITKLVETYEQLKVYNNGNNDELHFDFGVKPSQITFKKSTWNFTLPAQAIYINRAPFGYINLPHISEGEYTYYFTYNCNGTNFQREFVYSNCPSVATPNVSATHSYSQSKMYISLNTANEPNPDDYTYYYTLTPVSGNATVPFESDRIEYNETFPPINHTSGGSGYYGIRVYAASKMCPSMATLIGGPWNYVGTGTGKISVPDNPMTFENNMRTGNESLSHLKAYPNPSKRHIFIESGGINLIGEQYEILNLSGKKVSEGAFNNKIDVAEVQSGIYIIYFRSKNLSVKFIKQ